MQQWTCHLSWLLTPLTWVSTVGESYAVIYSKMSSNNKLQRSISRNMRHSSDKNWNCWLSKYADRICWQNVNLLTRKIYRQNLLTREICWQNLLTTKKPCRLDASKPDLKASHHASQAIAGVHIPSVKFKACICAGARPSWDSLLESRGHTCWGYPFKYPPTICWGQYVKFLCDRILPAKMPPFDLNIICRKDSLGEKVRC